MVPAAAMFNGSGTGLTVRVLIVQEALIALAQAVQRVLLTGQLGKTNQAELNKVLALASASAR